MKIFEWLKPNKKELLDLVEVDTFFNNEFHMEWGKKEYKFPKTMRNKTIIRKLKEEYSHYNCTIINRIYRNGVKIS